MEMSHLEARRAIFSTQLGKFRFRELGNPPPPVDVHSNFEQAVLEAQDDLRSQFPVQCFECFSIISLEQYFDPHDIYVKGAYFLTTVLNRLVQENNRYLIDFTSWWSMEYRQQLLLLCQPVSVEKIFDSNLVDRYGVTFLTLALQHMRRSLEILSQQQIANTSNGAKHATERDISGKDNEVSTSSSKASDFQTNPSSSSSTTQPNAKWRNSHCEPIHL